MARRKRLLLSALPLYPPAAVVAIPDSSTPLLVMFSPLSPHSRSRAAEVLLTFRSEFPNRSPRSRVSSSAISGVVSGPSKELLMCSESHPLSAVRRNPAGTTSLRRLASASARLWDNARIRHTMVHEAEGVSKDGFY